MWQLLWLDNTDTGCWRLILVMLWSSMMLKRKTNRKKKTEEQFLWTLYEDKPARLIIRFAIGFVWYCLSSQMCNSICYFFTRYFLTCRNRETVWEILQYVFSDVMEIYDIEEKQTELCWEKMLLTFCFKTTLLKLKCNGLNNSFKVFGTIIGIWSLILHTPQSGKIYHFRKRKRERRQPRGSSFGFDI